MECIDELRNSKPSVDVNAQLVVLVGLQLSCSVCARIYYWARNYLIQSSQLHHRVDCILTGNEVTLLNCLGITEDKVVLQMLNWQNPAFKKYWGQVAVTVSYSGGFYLVLMHYYEKLVGLYLILSLNLILLH